MADALPIPENAAFLGVAFGGAAEQALGSEEVWLGADGRVAAEEPVEHRVSFSA